MTFFESIFLGIIEGITEFLPISSTGHLILSSELLGIPESDFLKSFEIIIQLGAIASVVFLYWKSFLNFSILKKLAVGVIPATVVGFFLYNTIKSSFLGSEKIVLWSLFLGGVFLIIFEMFHKEKEGASEDLSSVSYTQAFLIGIFQSIAVIPGVSRSAATILGGLIVGLKRTAIVEFSFLLAVPTMLGASALDLTKSASSFSSDQFGVLAVGFIVSFIVAMASVKFLLGYVRKHTFIPFGIYRIILAILFFFLVI